jgi:TonB family protein
MIELAGREARPEPDSAGFYTWEAPGKPVAVAVPFTLIDQMEREAVENFRNVSSRGSEIGGLLFGAVAGGNPSLVTVTSYTQVVCDYGLGPLYRLAEADLSRLDAALAHAASAGMTPVGFFRTHTRKGLALDHADRKLLDSRFTQPHCVALLIRPSAVHASSAGIFIWENGEMKGDASYLEFSFRSSELMASPRPAVRARIVPIASRRDPVPATPQEIPVSRDEPSLRPKAIDSAPLRVAAAKGRRRRFMRATGIAGLGIALLLMIASSSALRHPPKTPVRPITLQLERKSNEVLLTWDLDAQVISNLSKAVLEITDGPRRQNILIDRIQLRHGSLLYAPSTSDVLFKLDATGSDLSLSESLRFLNPAAPAAIQPDPPRPKPEKAALAAAKAVPNPEPPPTPTLISRVEPEYPDSAREAGATGIVRLRATIGADGKVKSVKPLGGDALLIEPAIEAVRQWTYDPVIRNGVPLESEAAIELNFTGDR